MCEVKQRMETEEERARALIRPKDDSHLQMLYAQIALECARMQRVHVELCQPCMDVQEQTR